MQIRESFGIKKFPEKNTPASTHYREYVDNTRLYLLEIKNMIRLKNKPLDLKYRLFDS